MNISSEEDTRLSERVPSLWESQQHFYVHNHPVNIQSASLTILSNQCSLIAKDE